MIVPKVRRPRLELFRGLAEVVCEDAQRFAETLGAEGRQARVGEGGLDHIADFSCVAAGIAGQAKAGEAAVIQAHERFGKQGVAGSEQLILAQKLHPVAEALQVFGIDREKKVVAKDLANLVFTSRASG